MPAQGQRLTPGTANPPPLTPGCCCAPHDSIPLTVRKTKTVAAAKHRSAPEVANGALQERSVDAKVDRELSARDVSSAKHLCPRCPAGASVLSASSKHTGQLGYQYCCKRRTVTQTKTKTISVSDLGRAAFVFTLLTLSVL